jgi:c-di-GMP-binding flagellar brake protein YcgR
LQIEEISIGANIELQVRCNGKTMSFYSEVVEMKSNALLVNTVKVNEQTVGFSDICYINLFYIINDKLYVWENVTVKLVKVSGTIYHKIDFSCDGKPYNRRESYRMYIGEDMPIYVNTANGPTALSVLVKDISETGVGFITAEDIDIERTIRLKLKDNGRIINLFGVIVRKEFLSNLNSFLYGCKFNERNNLLGKYIAKKQGEQLKRKNNTYSSPPNVRDKRNSKVRIK